MGSILDLAKTEGMLFKYGSGTGFEPVARCAARASTSTAAARRRGPVSFMRGFDAFAGAIKSGGKTRRAAKMVILNVDHPDVVDFIDCKAIEEKKAWALIDAGYDGGFNVPGGAYDSVDYQNANHSVRVTDDFMRNAVIATASGRPARCSTAAWSAATARASSCARSPTPAHLCGDPGMQFDTTINDWHPCINTARINASNPCSEYMFLDDSACNLASLNLRKFQRRPAPRGGRARHRGVPQRGAHHDHGDGDHRRQLSRYPTPKIGENSHRFRPLGLGYANLGALLMSRGLPYDSDAGAPTRRRSPR